jgi:hypothetical protein
VAHEHNHDWQGDGPSRTGWSLWSKNSFCSIGSVGSSFSIGSVGSFFSIASVGSAYSAFSAGSWASFGSILSSLSSLSVLSHRSHLGVVSAPPRRARHSGVSSAEERHPTDAGSVGAGSGVEKAVSPRGGGGGRCR